MFTMSFARQPGRLGKISTPQLEALVEQRFQHETVPIPSMGLVYLPTFG